VNKFNAEAAEAGREFARLNPNATGPEIDDAAPPMNPARRHFQDAAIFALRTTDSASVEVPGGRLCVYCGEPKDRHLNPADADNPNLMVCRMNTVTVTGVRDE
jgi:hypothetical protein